MGENILSRPLGTLGLMLINVCVYFALQQDLTIDGNGTYEILVAYGALDPARVWSGEIWRLFSALFVHAGLLHMAFNVFVLFQVGRLLEPALGLSRFVLVYVITGVAGFAASLLFHHSIVMGASGAVFGLIGALLGVMLAAPQRLFQPRLMRGLLFFVVVNVGIGIVLNRLSAFAGVVDNAAHIGGLLTGFLFGVAFSSEALAKWVKGGKSLVPSFVSTIALIAVMVTTVIGVTLAVRPTGLPQYHLLVGQQALLEKDFAKAMVAQKALRALPLGVAWADLLEARIAVAEGRKEEARSLLEKALAGLDKNPDTALQNALWSLQFNLDPKQALFADEESNALICHVALRSSIVKDPTLLNECAWLLLMARQAEVHDEKLALTWIKRAVSTQQALSAEILHTLAEAYVQNGQLHEAQAAMERAVLLAHNRQTERFMASEKDRLGRLLKTSAPR